MGQPNFSKTETPETETPLENEIIQENADVIQTAEVKIQTEQVRQEEENKKEETTENT